MLGYCTPASKGTGSVTPSSDAEAAALILKFACFNSSLVLLSSRQPTETTNAPSFQSHGTIPYHTTHACAWHTTRRFKSFADVRSLPSHLIPNIACKLRSFDISMMEHPSHHVASICREEAILGYSSSVPDVLS
jgi:hypothetical protein